MFFKILYKPIFKKIKQNIHFNISIEISVDCFLRPGVVTWLLLSRLCGYKIFSEKPKVPLLVREGIIYCLPGTGYTDASAMGLRLSSRRTGAQSAKIISDYYTRWLRVLFRLVVWQVCTWAWQLCTVAAAGKPQPHGYAAGDWGLTGVYRGLTGGDWGLTAVHRRCGWKAAAP